MNIRSISLAVSALVFSTSVNAALITQSLNANLYTQGVSTLEAGAPSVLSTKNYSYTSFAGFDSSLGDLVSVYLDVSVLQSSLSGVTYANYYNGTARASGSIYGSYALNANVGAGNYDVTFSEVQGSNNINLSCIATKYCDELGNANIFLSNASINLLAMYQLDDFLINNIGFQGYVFTSAGLTDCAIWCASQSIATVNLDLTLNYVYDDGISAVPVPAAVWLFGSGLIGLISFAKRKKV